MSIQITPALLADRRQKAEACDSKEWVVNNPKKHDSDFPGISGVRTSDGYPVIHWSDHPHRGIYLESYAEYIAAASPAVMLALVAEIKRLRNRPDALECPNCGHPPKFCMCDEQTSGNETNFVTKGEHND